ncbi:hypothetical protein [Arthrobacter sp. H35-D1]|uniref:hypothetical protein n=1 Tax=Arthrobacter sp. H35-D1 TaxID=3046202 RepID=UPI0024B9C10C|nr:hypothetical protein [Arthrobacter sp. H35-D1]MDJ0313963.1 hypothetical protein [Arthrobacter sp. H35-D1]
MSFYTPSVHRQRDLKALELNEKSALSTACGVLHHKKFNGVSGNCGVSNYFAARAAGDSAGHAAGHVAGHSTGHAEADGAAYACMEWAEPQRRGYQ